MATAGRAPRARKASMVSREVVTTMDDKEHRVGVIFTALGAVTSAILILVALIHGTITETLTKKPVNGKCPSVQGGYLLYKSTKTTCSYELTVTKGDLLFGGLVILALTAVLAIFVARRRRTGTVFVSFIEGLAVVKYSVFSILPLLGFAYVFNGGWLLLRAYRLQKYGSPTRRGAVEAARAGGDSAPAASSVPRAEPAPRKPAEPSKRYTPKKQVKKRR